jgi:hypothetical protein
VVGWKQEAILQLVVFWLRGLLLPVVAICRQLLHLDFQQFRLRPPPLATATRIPGLVLVSLNLCLDRKVLAFPPISTPPEETRQNAQRTLEFQTFL